MLRYLPVLAVVVLAACGDPGRTDGIDGAYDRPEGLVTPQVTVIATLPAAALPVTRMRWSPETGRMDVCGRATALSLDAEGNGLRVWPGAIAAVEMLGGADGALLSPAESGWIVRDASGVECSRVAAPVAGLLWSPRLGAAMVLAAANEVVVATTIHGVERWRSDALVRTGLRPLAMATEGGEVVLLGRRDADVHLVRLADDGQLLGSLALPGVEDPTSFQAVPRPGGTVWALVTRRLVQVYDRNGRLLHRQPVPPLLGDGPVVVAYVPRDDGGAWAVLHRQVAANRDAVITIHDLTGRLLRRERLHDATAMAWDDRRGALLIAMGDGVVKWRW